MVSQSTACYLSPAFQDDKALFQIPKRGSRSTASSVVLRKELDIQYNIFNH
jgi:hypothetical protein